MSETQQTSGWLEKRFARSADGEYQPHQPIHGIASGEAGQFLRLARTHRLLRWLEALAPASVLDLGAAEGYIANLLRLRIGCPVLCSDLSLEACRRAGEIYGLPAIAGDLTRLPLKPGCADAVVLSEVFEHLPQPALGLSAALRYARRFVVLTTQELCASRFEQSLRLSLADSDSPHAELNFITRADLTGLFPGRIALAPEFRRTRRRLLQDVPESQWRDHIAWLAQPSGWRSAEGVIAVISVSGGPIPPLPSGIDATLLDGLMQGPASAPKQHAVWDWLDGSDPPAGLTLDAREIDSGAALHPLLESPASRLILTRLHVKESKAGNPAVAAKLLPMLERIGFLTSEDPLAVKLRWLLRRPLAG